MKFQACQKINGVIQWIDFVGETIEEVTEELERREIAPEATTIKQIDRVCHIINDRVSPFNGRGAYIMELHNDNTATAYIPFLREEARVKIQSLQPTKQGEIQYA